MNLCGKKSTSQKLNEGDDVIVFISSKQNLIGTIREVLENDKYDVDIFLGIGGGPEGVLAASAIDAYGCKFQGRFLFDNDKDINRAKQMGIKDLNKKYDLKEIIKGDSIFCATGITTGDLVKGINVKDNKYITETLVTHKSSNMCKIVIREDIIKT